MFANLVSAFSPATRDWDCSLEEGSGGSDCDCSVGFGLGSLVAVLAAGDTGRGSWVRPEGDAFEEFVADGGREPKEDGTDEVGPCCWGGASKPVREPDGVASANGALAEEEAVEGLDRTGVTTNPDGNEVRLASNDDDLAGGCFVSLLGGTPERTSRAMSPALRFAYLIFRTFWRSQNKVSSSSLQLNQIVLTSGTSGRVSKTLSISRKLAAARNFFAVDLSSRFSAGTWL